MIVSTGVLISVFEDGDDKGVIEIFRNLFTFPHYQDQTEHVSLQQKTTLLNQFVRDVIRTRVLS